MEDIMAIFLCGIAFALWFFLITESFFNNLRPRLISSGIVFVLMSVALAFEIWALGFIVILAIGLLSIIIAIGNQK